MDRREPYPECVSNYESDANNKVHFGISASEGYILQSSCLISTIRRLLMDHDVITRHTDAAATALLSLPGTYKRATKTLADIAKVCKGHS